MTTVNLCPHVVVVFDDDKKTEIKSYKPHGSVPRATSKKRKIVGTFDGVVPLVGPPEFIGVEGLPPDVDTPDHTLIVSMITATALKGQYLAATVLVPDTGPESVVRDKDGNILGCTRFVEMSNPKRRKKNNTDIESCKNWVHPTDGERREHSGCDHCARKSNWCHDLECITCGERDCPKNEPLHYHHDGCPACDH